MSTLVTIHVVACVLYLIAFGETIAKGHEASRRSSWLNYVKVEGLINGTFDWICYNIEYLNDKIRISEWNKSYEQFKEQVNRDPALKEYMKKPKSRRTLKEFVRLCKPYTTYYNMIEDFWRIVKQSDKSALEVEEYFEEQVQSFYDVKRPVKF